MQSQAKQEETLSLSKSIIAGNAGLAQMEMGLSIQDTFAKPTLRSVFKDHGDIGFSVVTILVKRFADSFGFSSKLSENQIETITVDTLENFAYESLVDVILFLKMARSGKLGTTGRGVDSNLIFGEWFPKYLELKAVRREENYMNTKNSSNSIPVSVDDVKKTYLQNHERKQSLKAKEFIDGLPERINREQLEAMISKWENDESKKPYLRMLKAKRKYIKE